jgi:1,4-dihydroxy-2-naphthoyl-CoA hydrolase
MDLALDTGLVKALGFRFDETGPDRVRIAWTVDDSQLQPAGVVHGGVYSAVVETAASVGAQLWFGDRGRVVGVSNQTDFLRQQRTGDRLTAEGVPIHRGRSQQLWLVEIRDEEARLVARGQVRLQNLTEPPG